VSLRSQTKPHANEPKSRPAEHAAKAEGIDRLPRDYSEVPVLGPPLPGDIGTAALTTPPLILAALHVGGWVLGQPAVPAGFELSWARVSDITLEEIERGYWPCLYFS
jgi:hypothetical protein